MAKEIVMLSAPMKKLSLWLEVCKMSTTHLTSHRSRCDRAGVAALLLIMNCLLMSLSLSSAAGASGYALEFDGKDDYVVTNDPYPFINETGRFSASAWVRINKHGTSTDTWNSVIGTGHAGPFRLVVTDQGLFRCTWDGVSRVELYSSPVAEKEWIHVLVQGDGSTIEMYVDGTRASQKNMAPLAKTPVNFAIGTWPNNPGQRVMNGIIDDVRLWTRPLTGDEIAAAMVRRLSGREEGLVGYWSFDEGEGTTAYDKSPLENHGTISGAVWTSTSALLAPPVLAWGPAPGNKALDVSTDVILRWEPGETAVSRDVYFGTAFADVNGASRDDPRDVLVSRDQTDTMYDLPGWLDFGTTYYWRIDEIGTPPDSALFKGDVWSFTTESLAYPLDGQRIKATASSAAEAQGPENTVNGSGLKDDLHSDALSAMWLTATGATGPAWIEYEFDKVLRLHEMWVWNHNGLLESTLGFGVRGAVIEYSVDGIEYLVLGTTHEFARAPGKPGYAHNTRVDLAGVAARYVRLTINGNWGEIVSQYGLSEVRFFYIPVAPREPNPASEAVGVSPDTALSWRSGREAALHAVYLSQNLAAVADETALAATVVTSSFEPAELTLGTTYYWKVNEINDAADWGVWEGEVWSFTTKDLLVIEDFENYTDTEGNRIYEAWTDGWAIAENGSQVGYDEAPFAERRIVHGGRQSMPLSYDNTAASYSEATRSFTQSQDWTLYGATTFCLFFEGRAENAAGQLYLKVNGTKVNYGGSPDDLKRAEWIPWNVELSSLGLNAKSVKTVAVGVEGGGASGTLYIDDMCLAKP